MAPSTRLELVTDRLTADSSTTELTRHLVSPYHIKCKVTSCLKLV